jgi:hypothetical protein
MSARGMSADAEPLRITAKYAHVFAERGETGRAIIQPVETDIAAQGDSLCSRTECRGA